MPQILLGAGSSRVRQVSWGTKEFSDLITVDFNDHHKPDVVHDLEKIPLPFPDDFADEIHAYHVLEHIGRQGDWRFFFAQFTDFWRILKPDGLLVGICPAWNGNWAWGDPGHTRIIQREQFIYLSQPEYDQVGMTACTDYRFVYKADFDVAWENNDGTQFAFVLKAVKPSRCKLA